uniref:LAGLIDADG homing endonuclease n=1 Tax=Cyathus pallidus TaxID=380665 RepID=UPI002551D96F|nr:LAGLIDADG homing endonuclease [Cyathus pallidus]WEV87299.1 LAGLIDADG homing endonuclease [Cyathus pallidus]
MVFTELKQNFYIFFEIENIFKNSFLNWLEIGEEKKILLYAGNSCLSNPLVLFTLGKTYLNNLVYSGQSAGNFKFSTFNFKIDKSNKMNNNFNNNNNNIYINNSNSDLVSPTLPNRKTNTSNNFNLFSFNNSNFQLLPKISVHVPKHQSQLTNSEFGFFLAGLIEGKGNFGANYLEIELSIRNISLAYLIKKRIGFGKVSKKSDSNTVRYLCNKEKGLENILSLINGKLVYNSKFDQLLKYQYPFNFNTEILPPLKELSLDNYWFAGFTQSVGSFQISGIKQEISVNLHFLLKHQEENLLKILLPHFSKAILTNNSKNFYFLKIQDFNSAALLINYFDKFHLFGGPYIEYLKFRKVYIMITEGKHLEEKGIKKIKSISIKGSSETSTQEI